MRVLTASAIAILMSASSALPADVVATADGHIEISGEILQGDAANFLTLISSQPFARGTVVRLLSNGGMVGEAVSIGLAIRERGFVSYAQKGTCASACALIWLGGAQLIRHPKAEIGFHQSFEKETMKAQGNAIAGFYLAKLGYSLKTSLFVTEAAPKSMLWLTDETAREVGIVFETRDLSAPKRLDFPDGSFYVGTSRNGRPDGKGTMFHKNGDVYIGDWSNGVRQGKGKLTFKTGDIFEGDFATDAIHGSGKMKYADGSSYDGRWYQALPDGYGRFYYSNGNSYAGNWRLARKHGRGVLTYHDGRKFSGWWVDGIKSGDGTLATLSGDVKITYEYGIPVKRD